MSETHSPSEPPARQDGAYNCPKCQSPDTHLEVMHSARDRYKCQNCGHKFTISHGTTGY
jgi:transposase-like protein